MKPLSKTHRELERIRKKIEVLEYYELLLRTEANWGWEGLTTENHLGAIWKLSTKDIIHEHNTRTA